MQRLVEGHISHCSTVGLGCWSPFSCPRVHQGCHLQFQFKRGRSETWAAVSTPGIHVWRTVQRSCSGGDMPCHSCQDKDGICWLVRHSVQGQHEYRESSCLKKLPCPMLYALLNWLHLLLANIAACMQDTAHALKSCSSHTTWLSLVVDMLQPSCVCAGYSPCTEDNRCIRRRLRSIARLLAYSPEQCTFLCCVLHALL